MIRLRAVAAVYDRRGAGAAESPGERARPRALSGAPRARLVVPPPACGRISFRSGPRGASLNARGGRGPREFRPASAPSAFSLPFPHTKTTLINSEK